MDQPLDRPKKIIVKEMDMKKFKGDSGYQS